VTWRSGLARATASVPEGGTPGQVLAKVSIANHDTAWADPSVGLPGGGTLGQVLAKASGTSYDVVWTDPAEASGDVVGPAASVDNRLAAFNGVTGKLIKDSGAALSAAAIAFLNTPSSANLRAFLTDEVGTGAALFVGGNLGTALATSLVVNGGGIGYTNGTGDAKTQTTSKSTGVALAAGNRLCGNIVTHAESLAAGALVSFVVTASACQVNDMPIVRHIAGGSLGLYNIEATPAAGSFTVHIRSLAAVPLAEALTLKFVIVKAVVV
jgi:hypothetical protein